MERNQICDVVRMVPEHRLAEFTAQTLQQGCDAARPVRLQIEDLLLALACIERLIVLASVHGDGAKPT